MADRAASAARPRLSRGEHVLAAAAQHRPGVTVDVGEIVPPLRHRGRTAPLHMSEAQFQSAVVDLAGFMGWRVMHIHDSRRGIGAGYPDLTLLHKTSGRLVFAELKSAKGSLSPQQREWLLNLQRGGHVVHVWRPRDFVSGDIQAELRRNMR